MEKKAAAWGREFRGWIHPLINQESDITIYTLIYRIMGSVISVSSE